MVCFLFLHGTMYVFIYLLRKRSAEFGCMIAYLQLFELVDTRISGDSDAKDQSSGLELGLLVVRM